MSKNKLDQNSASASPTLAEHRADNKAAVNEESGSSGSVGGSVGGPSGRPFGWLITSACLWGTVGVSGALLQRMQPTPSLMVGFLRMAFAALFLLGLTAFNDKGGLAKLVRLKPVEWLLFSLMGLAIAFYQVCYFAAIPLSSVTLVVVVALCSSPLIVALLSIPIFKERLTRRVVLALILALGGTALLAFGGGSKGDAAFFQPGYLLGAVLALGSGFGYSCFAILSKLVTQRSERGPVQTVAVSFSLSALLLLPVTALSGNLILDRAWPVWGLALYLGIVPTALAYIIFLRGIKGTSATGAAITTLLEPAVAAFLAWLVLGENLSLASLAGALLLVGSVGLLVWRKS